MTLKIFLTIFITVLLAELGDKTQLATLLFATNKENSKIIIFCAAALALIVSTGIAILLGNIISKYINVFQILSLDSFIITLYFYLL